MIEKIIEHPLKKILLTYDETKQETLLDKKLVKQYIKLHDDIYSLGKITSKLKYEYLEHDGHITDTEKLFVPIGKKFDDFLNEINFVTKNKANKESIKGIEERMHEFIFITDDFHENILTKKLVKESDFIEKEYKLFCKEDDKLDDKFASYDKFCISNLATVENKNSLDVNSLIEDKKLLRKAFNTVKDFYDDTHETVIQHYNKIMADITVSYDKWKQTKYLISNYYNDSGMLENSISQHYAKNIKLFDEDRPKYFISPDDEKIEEFRKEMGLMANSEMHTIIMDIPHDCMIEQQVIQQQELALTLQHFPKLLEKYIFSFQINFLDEVGIKMQDDDWKGKDEYMIWFNKLNDLPIMIFFMQDHDARAYCLLGDLVAKRTGRENGNPKGISFEGKEQEELAQRLFHCCWMFFMFCHKTGFNPEPYVEAILANFQMEFLYTQVKDKHESDIKTGMHFKVVKMDHNGKPLQS